MCHLICSLDFEKRDKDMAENPDADFDGQKSIHDNLNNAGPNFERRTNDYGFSWSYPSGFGPGHWDYDRSDLDSFHGLPEVFI
jgi:hypothetical protein